MTIDDAIRKAEEVSMGLIVTEHMDLKYPIQNKFRFDLDDYFIRYNNYRNDNLLLGIEMGMRPDCYKDYNAMSDKYDFDYILGSVHLVDGIDIYDAKYYENENKQKAYTNYFDWMLKCIKQFDFIDSLAHIDYIARYARFDDQEIYYKEFSDCIDEVLKVIAESNKAIEINTRRIGNFESRKNLVQVYKRFAELGGKFVTLGSDSHNHQEIGGNFKEAVEIADICGLKIVHFKERKMIVS
jgi:histidinol-phosphatase (PHP family)